MNRVPTPRELFVLQIIHDLGETAYGMTVHLEMEKRKGRLVSYGTVYQIADNLQWKGLIASEYKDPTAERGYRHRRYMRLLPDGEQALAENVKP